MKKPFALFPRNTVSVAAIGIVVVVIAIVFVIWKYGQTKPINAGNPAFAEYIAGYTTGVVSRESTIRVRLASQVGTFQQADKEETRELFKISPAVKGKTYWIDTRTVEFRPDGQLKPGQKYQVAFDLGKITDVSNDLKTFTFDLKVIEPSYHVEIAGLKAQTNS